ncbi:unnamed protein product [Notodromas monacha]|uniref:Aldehyde dehydrogenase n=1 Tax=Notodromas monacha TaxID=399045 RepID=A0A7R9GJ07_9CRUS|nr:unnamed protein product [Notodromas monacha]CAG0923016.1 unnamed protein product [Notodromas monacha]
MDSSDQMEIKFYQMVSELRSNFNAGVMAPVSFRKDQLRNMRAMMLQEADRLAAATKADLGKPYQEFYMSEIVLTVSEIDSMLENLNSYVANEARARSLATMNDTLEIQQSPLGVVLIIGAWNYPVSLMMLPALGAIAAGNCIVFKPSEVASHTETVLTNAIEKYLDKVKIIPIPIIEAYYVSFVIHSPCYLDNTVNMKIAAKRIMSGKLLNAGQTCIAPDYLMCTPAVRDAFIREATEVLKTWFPEGPKDTDDYCRIINDVRFQLSFLQALKLKQLIESSGKIQIGGHFDAASKYVSPTILVDVKLSDPIMQEEIFGPVLPIIVVQNHEEAISIINQRDHPLTTYVFSTDNKVIDQFATKTSSGSFVVNETVFHFAGKFHLVYFSRLNFNLVFLNMSVESLPFGGVGMSGLGKYHGKASFDAFVNKRAVMKKTFNPLIETAGG